MRCHRAGAWDLSLENGGDLGLDRRKVGELGIEPVQLGAAGRHGGWIGGLAVAGRQAAKHDLGAEKFWLNFSRDEFFPAGVAWKWDRDGHGDATSSDDRI